MSVLSKKWLASFEEAQSIVLQARIKSNEDYMRWDNKPANMPYNLKNAYGDKIRSYKDFFKKKIPSLAKTIVILNENNLLTLSQFNKWDDVERKKNNIPKSILVSYGFHNYQELLGNEKPRSFSKQKEWMITNTNLKSSMSFNQWMKDGNRPSFISSRPDRIFGNKGTNEWTSWKDFLTNNK